MVNRNSDTSPLITFTEQKPGTIFNHKNFVMKKKVIDHVICKLLNFSPRVVVVVDISTTYSVRETQPRGQKPKCYFTRLENIILHSFSKKAFWNISLNHNSCISSIHLVTSITTCPLASWCDEIVWFHLTLMHLKWIIQSCWFGSSQSSLAQDGEVRILQAKAATRLSVGLQGLQTNMPAIEESWIFYVCSELILNFFSHYPLEL